MNVRVAAEQPSAYMVGDIHNNYAIGNASLTESRDPFVTKVVKPQTL